MSTFETIDLIQEGSSREEIIIEVITSLCKLISLYETGFQSVESRIKSTHSNIEKLQERSKNVTKKIKMLSSFNNTIKILSLSKYPDHYEPSKILIPFPKPKEFLQRGIGFKQTLKDVNDYNMTPAMKAHSSYQINKKNKYPQFKVEEKKLTHVNCLDSVSSLLLFNTASLPYWEKSDVNPLGMNCYCEPWEEDQFDGQFQNLGRVPKSLVDSDMYRHFQTKQEQLLYNPVVGNTPTVDLPTDLPALENLVSDIEWSQTIKSFSNESLNLDVVQATVPLFKQSNISSLDSNDGLHTSNTTKLEKSVVHPSITVEKKIETSKIVSQDRTSPPTLKKSDISRSFGGNRDISGLLDEIRKSGGTQSNILKPVVDRFKSLKTKKNDPKQMSSIFDVFTELGDRLKARRTCLEGIKKDVTTIDQTDSFNSKQPTPIHRLMSNIADEQYLSTEHDNSEEWA